MAKKMTTKEFLEIMKETTLGTDYEKILNALTIFYDKQMIDLAEHNLNYAAKLSKENSDFIFKKLMERGYYN